VADQRHLPHAPIMEAVINIQSDPVPNTNFQRLETAFAELDFGYRHHGAMLTQTVQLGASPAGIAPSVSAGSPERIGMRLQSADDHYVALVRVDGLSLSRLTPYETWDTLEVEARRLWDLYVERWKPKTINRVATRFVNNLRLPLQAGQSLSLYIETLTELPPTVPQDITAFLQQFQILDAPTNQTVRLSLAWDGRGEPGIIPIILDIDAVKQVALDVHDDSLWTLLRDLRDLKNRCFFGTLTEKAIDGYL
jgi:uncharacterized protein (TIGR04255 family)